MKSDIHQMEQFNRTYTMPRLVCFVIFMATVGRAQIQTEVKPATLGSSVTLHCTISRSNFLVWEKMTSPVTALAIQGVLQGHFVNSTRTVLKTRDQKQSLTLNALELQDDGEYRCYDLNNITRKDVFQINIMVHPSNVYLSNISGQIDEGSQQTITCEADVAKPPPYIDWYLLQFNGSISKLTGKDEMKQFTNGTWYKRSDFTFVVSREMYRATVMCNIRFPFFYNYSKEVNLDVNLAPLKPTMDYFTGLFNVGESKTITCTSDGSRPAANIEWYLDGSKISNIVEEVTPRSDGTYTVRGVIVNFKFSRSMDGSKLKCLATNSVLKNTGARSVSSEVTLLPTYAPRITSENGTREVIEHFDVQLTCTIDARPMPIPQNIYWKRNGILLSGSRYNFSTGRVADLHITSVSRKDIGDYSCQAANTIGIATSSALHLDVLYSPVCVGIGTVRYAASIGNTVRLTCIVDGNPGNSTMTWTYTRMNSVIQRNIVAKAIDGIPRRSLTTIVISLSTDWQYTDIECRATNAIGVSKVPCLYQIVRPGPPEVPTNCSSTTLTDTEVRVECNAGFDGGSPQHFILQILEDSSYESATNETMAVPVFHKTNLDSGATFTFRVCAVSDSASISFTCSNAITAKTLENQGSKAPQIATAGSTNNTGYIAGGVLGSLVLIVIVAIIIVVVIRKRKQVRKSQHFKTTMQHIHSISHRIYRDPDIHNYAHEQHRSTFTNSRHEHFDDMTENRSVRFDRDVSLYGYDPTKTIRKSQTWNNCTNQQLLY